ncbi:MAG: hypothetical protein ACR2MF_06205 [Chthoniobacterales bacterium]
MLPPNELQVDGAYPRRRIGFIGPLFAGSAVVALMSILFGRDPNLFWNDDYELSILPVFADVARSWSEGHFPLLSPYSWVCSNLAGEFQYGTFSAFINAGVVLIWKFPLTFSQQAAALSMSHLFALGAGGYVLARGRNLTAPLSTMVALVTAANGWIVCWGATDWFGALGALTWFPWAWWGLERALDQKRGRYRFLWPAPFVYLLIAGGFPYTVLMLGLLTAWLALQKLVKTRALASILPLALGSLLGTGLSSPAWLALFEYVHGSLREAQESVAHFQWVVPLRALPGFILPSWTTNWTDFSTRSMPHTAAEMACGLVAPVALVFGFSRFGRSLVRQIKWELGLLILVLIISMLPSPNVFRWSFRWLPFVHLVLAICAAHTLQMMHLKQDGGARRILLGPGAVAVALVALTAAAMFATRSSGPYGGRLSIVMLGIAVLWAGSELLLERLRTLRSWIPAAITFSALLATYLSIPPNCGVPRYNLSQQLTTASPLDPVRLYLSVYPPAEHTYRMEKKPEAVGQIMRPGSTSLFAGIRLINGYSPIRPSGVAREFGFAIHGEIDPIEAENLLTHEAGPEGELSLLGVDGIVVARELTLKPAPETEWQLATSTNEGRVYHRSGEPFARVRAVTAIDSRPNEQFASAAVTIIEDSRNRVVVDVNVPDGNQPALLTFARPYFNGYRARVAAKRFLVGSHRGLMPVVELPAGTKGRLVLDYRPWWLVGGVTIAAACALVVIGGAIVAARNRRL